MLRQLRLHSDGRTDPNKSKKLDRRDGEDDLEYCHRLLAMQVPMRTIAERTGFPLSSVQHVQTTNAYRANWN